MATYMQKIKFIPKKASETLGLEKFCNLNGGERFRY